MTGDDEALRAQLRQLGEVLREEMRSRWDRDLPFEELVFDRWERAASLDFGPDASIYQSSYVYGDVSVGSGTWIGPFTLLDGSGAALRIGSNCSVSAGVQIYTHDSVRRALSGGQAELDRAPVTIGDDCYIGPNVIVAKGVTIGPRTVVGAGSFVNRDLPPNSIAVGTPCRVVGSVQIHEDGAVELVYGIDEVADFSGS